MSAENLAMTGHNRPLKVGLCLDTLGLTTDGVLPSWPDFLAMAQRAEETGFASLWLPDHLLVRWPNATGGSWECWSLLAALAAATQRIELGTIVLSTSFRNPALLAKMAAAVDDISGGRLTLGIGAGWQEPEYTAFGYPYDHRASRFEEAFTIIRALLREGRIDFDGRFYQARECELLPRAARAGGPPIMVGTRGERMLRLTAAHADMWNGWLVGQGNDVATYRPLRDGLDAACAAMGRDPATLSRSVGVTIGTGALSLPMPPPIEGSLEVIADALRAFAHEGVDHIQVLLAPTTLATIEGFAPVLALLGRG